MQGFKKLYKPSAEEVAAFATLTPEERESAVSAQREIFRKERADLIRTENEKNFDTLTVTISSIAIAASFTLMKDFVKGSSVWLYFAWCSLMLCLIGSLVDRLVSYVTAKEYRHRIDCVFRTQDEHYGHEWHEVDAQLNEMRGKKVCGWFPAEKFLTGIKFFNGGMMVAGIVFLMAYAMFGTAGANPTSPPPFPVTINNVYNAGPTTSSAATQPTTATLP